MSGFVAIPLADGGRLRLDGLEVRTWAGAVAELDGGTVFGCVDRPTEVVIDGDRFRLRAATYFVAPDGARVEGGRGIAVVLPGYRGLRQIGGPLEPTGRLRYIDGCTDTLLLAPPRLGEPCLNLLHIPPHTHQSEHTHPSLRAGVIVSGRGRCRTRREIVELRPGTAFLIPAGVHHCFNTDREPLRVIAYHPDSDFGPTDEDHPMVNRTHLAVSVR